MNQAEATVTTGREEKLEEAVAGMRIGGLHGPEARALAIGSVLLAVSIVLVIVGYYGTSGTLNVGEQVPYLMTGGFLALVVAVIGAAVFVRYSLGRYLRYWLIRQLHEHREQTTRMLEEQRAQTDRLVEVLQRLEAAVGERSAPRV